MNYTGAYSTELDGFIKKAFKPVRKVKKAVGKPLNKVVFRPLRKVRRKIESTIIPKRVRKFTARLKRNPIFKVVTAVALSVVAAAILGPIIGKIVGKVAGGLKTTVGTAKAARIGNAANNASKTYKNAKRVKGAVNVVRDYKQMNRNKRTFRAQRNAAAAATSIAAVGAVTLPTYSPVGGSIDTPAIFQLARAEALSQISGDLAKMTPEQREETIWQIEDEIRDLQRDTAAEINRLNSQRPAGVPSLLTPRPMAATGLDTDALVAQGDSLRRDDNLQADADLNRGEPVTAVLAAGAPPTKPGIGFGLAISALLLLAG